MRLRKLSYGENRELDALPERIDALESERQELHTTLSDPELYRDGTAVPTLRSRLENVESELEAALARWEQLEEIRQGEV